MRVSAYEKPLRRLHNGRVRLEGDLPSVASERFVSAESSLLPPPLTVSEQTGLSPEQFDGSIFFRRSGNSAGIRAFNVCSAGKYLFRTETKQAQGGKMNRARFLHMAWTAAFLVTASMLTPTTGYSQTDPKITKAMADLKAATAKLGPPKLEGTDAVNGKNAAALYFGKTKMNNDFSVVDAVVKDDGGTATIFAKTGKEYVRVSTNVPKGSGRATGTILDPKGKVIVRINKGKAFYGDVDILGTMYTTGYEPIKDASGKVIGIWYVGYKK